MKYSKPFVLLGLFFSLGANTLSSSAKSLENAYLEHWFSVDHSQPVHMQLSTLPPKSNPRNLLSFTSDDGQQVNGILAYPTAKTENNKLALVLHPMGLDQEFWWSEQSPLSANLLIDEIRAKGYTVISLDARVHGQRKIDQFTPRDLITKAHSEQSRLYIDTIIGSVRDYRSVLHWAEKQFQPTQVLVAGYSMGAQMGLLLASYEPNIHAVLAMVPPFVKSANSPVAPRNHVERITQAKVLWLAAEKDKHSSREQTEITFNNIASSDKHIEWFDSGHRLPKAYLAAARQFFASLKNVSLKDKEI